MIVVATDAPLNAPDLHRLAARAVFGMARTGASYANGSGDCAIAFSTSLETRSQHGRVEPKSRMLLPPDALSPLFQAGAGGHGGGNRQRRCFGDSGPLPGKTVEALPVDRLRAILKKFGMTP